MIVVRCVVVTVVGAGKDTFGSLLPEPVTFTASEAEPEAGHARSAAVDADAEEDDDAAGEDEAFVEAGVEQPASRATPLTATRAGRSLRGRCTGAS
ncbi:hypothetical protein GCM10025783_06220 [Amnibacterium soli]|uniref:Secreted protein n=1 Tax=Amnibacterium soli TaxID=1282736 RepID=A0ABP8YV55_9MICO